jgi:hypothetical protein
MEKLKIIKAIVNTVPRVPSPIHNLLLVEVVFQLIVLLRGQRRRGLWEIPDACGIMFQEINLAESICRIAELSIYILTQSTSIKFLHSY